MLRGLPLDLVGRLGFLRRVLRAISGAPDYDQYVTHMRVSHPGASMLTLREFHDERLRARYERPGSRCC